MTYVVSTAAPLEPFPPPGAYRVTHRPSAAADFSKSTVTARPVSTSSNENQSSSLVVTSAPISVPCGMAAAVDACSLGSYWSVSVVPTSKVYDPVSPLPPETPTRPLPDCLAIRPKSTVSPGAT